MEYLFILSIILNIILSFFILKKKKVKKENRKDLFSRFPEVISIFESAKQVSFEYIWNKHLLVHTTSGFTTEKLDLSEPKTEFIKEVYFLCGDNIIEDLNEIFGNEETLIRRIGNYFILNVRERELEVSTKITSDQVESSRDLNPPIKIENI